MTNTVLNVGNSVLTALVAFFLVRFLLAHLGDKQYGIWVLVASVFQFRILLNMGLNSAVNRFVPICLANEDHAGINKVISTSFFFYCCLALVLVCVSVIAYRYIDTWFTIESELVPSARYLVLIVGLCFSAVMPLQMASAVLSGFQRYDIINFALLSTLLLRTVLLIVFLTRGYGLLTVGLLFAGSEIGARLIQLVFVRRVFPQMSISMTRLDLRLLLSMVTYGVNSMLYAVGVLVLAKASSIVIGIFLGTAEVGYFAVALAGVLLLSQIIQTFSQAIKPAASDLGARDDNSRLNEMAALSQKYSLLMLIPAGCFFIVMGREFLMVWVGDAIGDITIINRMAQILAILVVANGLRLAQHSNYVVLVGLGEHRVFGIMMIVNAVLFVTCAVVCLKVFHLGLLSVAWSFSVPMVLISGCLLPVYFRYKRHITFMDNIRQSWYPALRGACPAVVLILVWKYVAPPASWPQLIAVVACAAAMTMASSWIWSLSEIERIRFIRIVAQL